MDLPQLGEIYRSALRLIALLIARLQLSSMCTTTPDHSPAPEIAILSIRSKVHLVGLWHTHRSGSPVVSQKCSFSEITTPMSWKYPRSGGELDQLISHHLTMQYLRRGLRLMVDLIPLCRAFAYSRSNRMRSTGN